MIKQMKFFRHDNMKELESFLIQHPGAELLAGEHFLVDRQTRYIMSAGDKKNLQCVPRPAEKPYQIPAVYAVYEIDGNVTEGTTVKTRSFSATDNIEEINKFLAGHFVQKIFLVPVLEKTGPLDNYYAGEYGPVPDRSPATVISHRLIVIYKE